MWAMIGVTVVWITCWAAYQMASAAVNRLVKWHEDSLK